MGGDDGLRPRLAAFLGGGHDIIHMLVVRRSWVDDKEALLPDKVGVGAGTGHHRGVIGHQAPNIGINLGQGPLHVDLINRPAQSGHHIFNAGEFDPSAANGCTVAQLKLIKFEPIFIGDVIGLVFTDHPFGIIRRGIARIEVMALFPNPQSYSSRFPKRPACWSQ